MTVVPVERAERMVGLGGVRVVRGWDGRYESIGLRGGRKEEVCFVLGRGR